MFDLSGKVAIVTGSGRGLGRTIAEGVAAAGAGVAVCSRSLDEAEATAAAIRAGGGTALAVRADVTDPDSCAALVEAAVHELGGVHLLVDNAGIEIVEPADATSHDTWQRILATNLEGAATCARLAAVEMERAVTPLGRRGRSDELIGPIVFLASAAASPCSRSTATAGARSRSSGRGDERSQDTPGRLQISQA